jgi:hypothetical protein
MDKLSASSAVFDSPFVFYVIPVEFAFSTVRRKLKQLVSLSQCNAVLQLPAGLVLRHVKHEQVCVVGTL